MRRFPIVVAVLLMAVIGAIVVGRRIYISHYASNYEEQILDRSVLTHNPCAPPCWHGIVPGATMSLEQVEEIVSKVPSVWSWRAREDPRVGYPWVDYDSMEWSWSGWPGSPTRKWLSRINSILV